MFEGIAEMTIFNEVSVRLNEEKVMNLPNIQNLENQTLKFSFSDDKTG